MVLLLSTPLLNIDFLIRMKTNFKIFTGLIVFLVAWQYLHYQAVNEMRFTRISEMILTGLTSPRVFFDHLPD